MNELKSISQTDNELRVGNYIVLFGGRDLTGEFFTKSTDFQSNYTDIGTLYVDFEHGKDPDGVGNTASNVLGIVDWKSATIDDKGIFVERVLNRRAKYVKYLSYLIEEGVIGTSSQCTPGQSVRKATGEIIRWPMMRDSLTVTPVEPRMISVNALSAIKSLSDIFTESKSLALAMQPIDNSIKIIESINDLKSVEQYLRDAGMSRTEAKAIIARVKSLGPRDAGEDELKTLVDSAMKRYTF